MLGRFFPTVSSSAGKTWPAARTASVVPPVLTLPFGQPVRFASWSRAEIWRMPYAQQPVVDVSVLRTTEAHVPLHVIDAALLSRAGSKIASGRSRGHKVVRQLPDGSKQYFYYKLPYYRGGFVKELVAAALARHLLGVNAPMVYAVESPVTTSETQSQYALVSESLGTNVSYDNLENWALLYDQDDEELNHGPRHLGLSLAFKLLMGDSDAKAANFVLLRNHDGRCYPIDHEYAFDKAPEFINDAGLSVNLLKDFSQGENDRHIPLQGNVALLCKIRAVFKHAVQNDLNDGSVMAMYERFAAMTEVDINALFEQYGSLINKEERAVFIVDLKARQDATKAYIKEYQNEQRLIEDFRTSVRGMRM